MKLRAKGGRSGGGNEQVLWWYLGDLRGLEGGVMELTRIGENEGEFEVL